MLNVMKSAAAAIISEFSSIWFVHPESGANKLWDIGEPRTDFSLLDDVTKDCPVASYSMLIGTLKDEDWIVSVGAENTVETILLQPPLAGIARAVQVSEQWLQTYVNEKYAKVSQQVQVTPKKGEADD